MSIKSFIEDLFSENKNYIRKQDIHRDMKDLPLGIQDFKKIRKKDYLYVDKTEHLYKLIDQGEVYFLSRPRRFGKSLTVSTLEYLFKGEKELFKGTYIYDKHDFEEHPVINLSMDGRSTDSTKKFEESLRLTLEKLYEKYDLEMRTDMLPEAFEELIEKIANKYKDVVVLIDEYDKPILDNIENPEKADKIREILRSFYSILKKVDPYLKFIFITGITKASKVSIFSDLNQLTDLTLNSKMSDILGYTKEDIAEFFPERIGKAKKELGLTEEEFWSKLQEWYNGYSWDGEDFVYNPYSILSFFFNNEFDNYWFESGSPSFIVKYAKKNELEEEDFQNVKVTQSFHSKYDIENAPSYSFLWQAGYLTIKKVTRNSYILDYPNKEVDKSMKELLLGAVYDLDDKEIGNIEDDLFEYYDNNDIDGMIEEFKKAYSAIPHQKHVKKEGFYDSIAYTFLLTAGIDARAEESTSRGDSDIVLEKDARVFIFEFKNDKPEVGIEQIKEKGYAEKYDKKKFFVGIELDFDERNIVDYKVEEQY